jgi:hypothetical protein
LHALVGDGITELTRILNQQLSAAVMITIADNAVTRDADGKFLLLGGFGKFDFNVKRVGGPGSDYLIDAIIRLPHVDAAMVSGDGSSEMRHLDRWQSYLRATLTLRVSADFQTRTLVAPPRFQYNVEDSVPPSP